MKVWLRDKSGIRLYRFVVEDIDRHGNVRVYFRRKGQPKIRLFEMPGTAAFDAEYQRAFSGEQRPPSTSQHTAAIPRLRFSEKPRHARIRSMTSRVTR